MELDEIKLIKDSYENCNVEVHQELINRTVARCWRGEGIRPRKNKVRNVFYYRYAPLFASLIIFAMSFLYVNSNINWHGSNHAYDNTPTRGADDDSENRNDNDNDDELNDNNNDLYKIAMVINSFEHYDIKKNDIDELIKLSEEIVLCRVESHKSVIGYDGPATLYEMKVKESYYGGLKKGDIFHLDRKGGYFKYDELKNYIPFDDNITIDPELLVEVLSIDNTKNFRIGEEYLLFMYKNNNGNYSTVYMNSGIFTLENNSVIRNLSRYDSPNQSPAINLNDVLNRIFERES